MLDLLLKESKRIFLDFFFNFFRKQVFVGRLLHEIAGFILLKNKKANIVAEAFINQLCKHTYPIEGIPYRSKEEFRIAII